jgi:DNA-binding MarR family transcriptional regulator
MNEKITDILDILAQDEDITQREIAQKTGISLGLVNILIKKCAKKGLLKIERINSRNIKYILTPEGITEMTNRTINYVKRSYIAIKKLQWRIKELAEKHSEQGKKIYILNREKDEVFQLVRNTLNELNIKYSIINDRQSINDTGIDNEGIVIYYWDPELFFNDNNIETINIFQG